jgi:repressor LexA
MKRTKEMTARQKQVYEFIRDKIRTRGYGPTVREIGDEFEIRSPNGVVCHLRALVKKGMITRRENMARAIELVKEGPMGLPQVGVVTPGQPLEEQEAPTYVDFGPLFQSKDAVVLKVGKAVAQAGVAEGDYLAVSRKPTASKGQTVVATTADGAVVIGAYSKLKSGVRVAPLGGKGKAVTGKLKLYGVVLAVVRMM